MLQRLRAVLRKVENCDFVRNTKAGRKWNLGCITFRTNFHIEIGFCRNIRTHSKYFKLILVFFFSVHYHWL